MVISFKRELSSGGVVIQRDGAAIRILLIKDPYGKWTWPKGKLNKGETSADAASREIGEETGLKNIKMLSLIGRTNYFYKRNGNVIYKTVYIYLFEFTGNEDLFIQKSEIKDGEWVSEDEALLRVKYRGAKRIMSRAITVFERTM